MEIPPAAEKGPTPLKPSTQFRYTLHIYAPDSDDEVWMRFGSDSPFLALSKGDLINPAIWPDTERRVLAEQNMLRVVDVEHIIWEAEEQIKHAVLVYTEEIEGGG